VGESEDGELDPQAVTEVVAHLLILRRNWNTF